MTDDKISSLVVYTNNLFFKAADRARVSIHVSEKILAEVCVSFFKELDKLNAHQGDHISITKQSVALAFWVRRLKPIVRASRSDGSGVDANQDLTDINERMAVWIVHLMLGHYSDSDIMPNSFRALSLPDKKLAFKRHLEAYWKLDNHYNYNALVYALRYRNISPHHMALYFDGLVSGFTLKHS